MEAAPIAYADTIPLHNRVKRHEDLRAEKLTEKKSYMMSLSSSQTYRIDRALNEDSNMFVERYK